MPDIFRTLDSETDSFTAEGGETIQVAQMRGIEGTDFDLVMLQQGGTITRLSPEAARSLGISLIVYGALCRKRTC